MDAKSLTINEPSPLGTAGWRVEMMWIVLERFLASGLLAIA
jgi:hypothetical protein